MLHMRVVLLAKKLSIARREPYFQIAPSSYRCLLKILNFQVLRMVGSCGEFPVNRMKFQV